MIEQFIQFCPTLNYNLSNLINQRKLNFGDIAMSITTQNAHLLMGQHFISSFRLYLHLGKLKETQFRKLCDRMSPLSMFAKLQRLAPKQGRLCLQASDSFGVGSGQTASCQVPDTCCFLSGRGE